MKTLIFVFLVFFLCGCNKKSDESVMLERCQDRANALEYTVAFRLSEMYQEVASCALLAKCVGAQIGDVEPITIKPGTISPSGYSVSYAESIGYKCVLRKNTGLKSSSVERIDLNKVKLMLEGCIRGK